MEDSVWSYYICIQNIQRALKEISDTEFNKYYPKHPARYYLGKSADKEQSLNLSLPVYDNIFRDVVNGIL